MTIAEGHKVNRQINQELCLVGQLFLHHNSPVQRLHQHPHCLSISRSIFPSLKNKIPRYFISLARDQGVLNLSCTDAKAKVQNSFKKRHFKLHQSTTDGVICSLIHTLPLGTPQPLLLKFSMIDVRALTDFLCRRMSINDERLCAFSESSSNVKIALNWIGVACLPCFTEVRMSKTVPLWMPRLV